MTKSAPIPIPSSDWNDEPTFCLAVNDQWASVVIGALRSIAYQEFWEGGDEDKWLASQQIEEIILSLMTRCAPISLNMFGDGVPPSLADFDTVGINLGTKFSSSVSGTVTGIRFYRNEGDNASHVGTLYSISGDTLASAIFEDGTDAGWQAAIFDTPFSLEAEVDYIASVWYEAGNYPYQQHFFDTDYVNGNFTAKNSTDEGGSGVYLYDTEPSFPTDTANATCYFSDVIFIPD